MKDETILLGLGFVIFPQDSKVLEAMRIARQDERKKFTRTVDGTKWIPLVSFEIQEAENAELRKEIEELLKKHGKCSWWKLAEERGKEIASWKARWEGLKERVELIRCWDWTTKDDILFIFKELESGGEVPKACPRERHHLPLNAGSGITNGTPKPDSGINPTAKAWETMYEGKYDKKPKPEEGICKNCGEPIILFEGTWFHVSTSEPYKGLMTTSGCFINAEPKPDSGKREAG